MNDRILKYLNSEVEIYLKEDIKKLQTIRPEGREGIRGCTIPTGMFLLSIIDHFGFLIRKKIGKGDTETNFKELFEHPIVNFPKEYRDKREVLVGLYRNGMMHQIFPKGVGISKNGKEKNLFFEMDRTIHLDVDWLSQDVLDFLEDLKSNLSNPQHVDLVIQMSERLDKLESDDFYEMGNKLEKHFPEIPKFNNGD